MVVWGHYIFQIMGDAYGIPHLYYLPKLNIYVPF